MNTEKDTKNEDARTKRVTCCIQLEKQDARAAAAAMSIARQYYGCGKERATRIIHALNTITSYYDVLCLEKSDVQLMCDYILTAKTYTNIGKRHVNVLAACIPYLRCDYFGQKPYVGRN